jgi:lipid-binding SYLF domain-containing protein
MNLIKFPLLLAVALLCVVPQANAYTASQLDRMSRKALHRLLSSNAKAEAIAERAVAVLVFPKVIKGGFMVGLQRGDGVLYKDGAVAGYYNTTAASYGYQAGIQEFSYALFFMDHDSLKYLKKSDGFELGGAPSLVVMNEGGNAGMSTTTLQKGICAFFFGSRGIMAGLGVQGTKITRYYPSE